MFTKVTFQLENDWQEQEILCIKAHPSQQSLSMAKAFILKKKFIILVWVLNQSWASEQEKLYDIF